MFGWQRPGEREDREREREVRLRARLDCERGGPTTPSFLFAFFFVFG
jgi:hypothetical protein